MSKFEKIIELFISKDSTFLGNIIKSGNLHYIIDYSDPHKEFRIRLWKEVED